jgi:hypothetical protein
VAAVAPHSSTSVVWNADRFGLLGTAPEHLQGRKPPKDVEEVGVHPCQLAFAAFGEVAHAASDQAEQQYEHRARDQQDRHGPRVEHRDDACNQDGHEDGEDARGDVARDVRVEGIDPLTRRVDELADPLAPDRGGAEGDECGGQPFAQIGLDPAGSTLGHDLARPEQHPADEREGEHREQQGLDGREVPTVDEDTRDRTGKEERERDPADGGRRREPSRGSHGSARARVVLPEAALDRARASAPTHPPGSGRNARA